MLPAAWLRGLMPAQVAVLRADQLLFLSSQQVWHAEHFFHLCASLQSLGIVLPAISTSVMA
jgi:hypothetical protein